LKKAHLAFDFGFRQRQEAEVWVIRRVGQIGKDGGGHPGFEHCEQRDHESLTAQQLHHARDFVLAPVEES
jgi:hypothetical protein